MAYVVLVVWVIQGGVGAALLVPWARHGRHRAAVVLSHVALALLGLGLWFAFVVTSTIVWAWLAFATITVANGIGDAMLLTRSRRLYGTVTGFWADYGRAARDAFAGRLPRHVTFHTLFSGVVYFLCLGVSIGATVA